jgi:hypothetical protein
MNNTIPFIFDYCDGWCCHCGFTKNCAVYVEMDDLPGEEIEDTEFREIISIEIEGISQTFEIISDQPGIVGDELTVAEIKEMERKMLLSKEMLKKSDLVKSALDYIKLIDKIFADRYFWKSKARLMAKNVSKGIVGVKESGRSVDRVQKSIDVIQWYFTFIHMKFSRAIVSKIQFNDGMGLQSDANGSAKIALIAVERSINAFKELLKIFGNEKKLIEAVSVLEHIQRLGSLEFPNAEFFIRPGFDEQ